MIIQNKGPVKDVKIDGVFIKINPGITVLKDHPIIEKLVKVHKDLSILKEMPKPVIKQVKPILNKVLDHFEDGKDIIIKKHKGRKPNDPQ